MMRARMAVWLLEEPWRVTKARILSLGSCTVSLGVRSSATRMPGSSMEKPVLPPHRMFTRRVAMSFTSTERACM